MLRNLRLSCTVYALRYLQLCHQSANFVIQVLPEKEARAIASQIFDGLAYLNGPSRRIIHYDLKPANILFNQLGEVKITVSLYESMMQHV